MHQHIQVFYKPAPTSTLISLIPFHPHPAYLSFLPLLCCFYSYNHDFEVQSPSVYSSDMVTHLLLSKLYFSLIATQPINPTYRTPPIASPFSISTTSYPDPTMHHSLSLLLPCFFPFLLISYVKYTCNLHSILILNSFHTLHLLSLEELFPIHSQQLDIYVSVLLLSFDNH